MGRGRNEIYISFVLSFIEMMQDLNFMHVFACCIVMVCALKSKPTCACPEEIREMQEKR